VETLNEKWQNLKSMLLQMIPLMQQYLTQVQLALSKMLSVLSNKKDNMSSNIYGPERIKVGETFTFGIAGVQQLETLLFAGEPENTNVSLANVKLSISCIATGMPYEFKTLDEILVGTSLAGFFTIHPRVPVHSGNADEIYKIDGANQIEAQPVPPLIYGKATVILEDLRELPAPDAYVWITLHTV